ncbi:serine hydrolase domain-containing protein [Qipengyuania sp. MTN3-11]|uniref:serine hydrolase domain-containing protein n=1 Tax=Qipengyuania sp. MTN3-11 TaxID=3056557 RepID=UPI0036F3EAE2
MIRRTIAAAALLAIVVPSASAQTVSQEQLDARYDRAMAAGYKALFLCGAIGNSHHMAKRTPEDIARWELTGIYPDLDPIVQDLPYRIEVHAGTALSTTLGPTLHYVAVDWDDRVPPRIALYKPRRGCSILPIGAAEPVPAAKAERVLPGPMPTMRPQAETPVDPVTADAFQSAYGEGTRTTAVLVQRSGDIISERYAAAPFGLTTPQRTWSVAKSIAATLVGAAVLRGDADVNASAGLGADAADPRRAITVDHALRMATGRYSEAPGNRTDALYFGGATVQETALDGPLVHRPGTMFRYANNDTLAATQAIAGTFTDYPPGKLFSAIGMNQTTAETDWQGDYVLSSQVWATARDLARLGQLYLDDGMAANGTRILPEDWVEYVSSPSGPQPEGEFGYGAGFWLFNDSEGVPPETFAAMGNRGQYVVIVPSRDVVIVRRGEDPTGARFDITAFTRDVLAALD